MQQFKGYSNKNLREAMTVDGGPFANALNRIGKGVDGLTASFKNLSSKLTDTNIGREIAGLSSSTNRNFGKLTSAADLHFQVFSTGMSNGFSLTFDKLGRSRFGSVFTRAGASVRGGLPPPVGYERR